MTGSEPRSSDAPAAVQADGNAPAGEDPQQREPQQGAVIWRKLSGLFTGRRGAGSLRENLQDELARETGGDTAFSPEERLLLGNILRLRELRVDDVMIPRADIEAVDAGITLGRLMELFQDSGHSRMPVYEDTLDDPRGMVHIKDLMALMVANAKDEDTAEPSGDDESVEEAAEGVGHNSAEVDLSKVDLSLALRDAGLVRQLLFVPPSMPATDLMAKMQADRIQMALVIDEYGGTDGLVSLEDLVEEVVGDIEDEHDEDEEAMLQAASEGMWIADPRMPLEDLGAELGTDFETSEASEDVDTLGGLLYVSIGRVPVRGELLLVPDVPGYEFEILDADPRRIKRLRIRRRRPEVRITEQRRRVKREDVQPVEGEAQSSE
ncbi:HlyC/CorC family transporter [Roseibium polysiphoniae]|uniref:HlyC/CorC family transporter n=1 Tax=Roseibium polysiphoniae TaxID=2571221 RepID=A0A944GV60_9HYPH|nr:hemolysin family protein [Roseibium polysiphoniae]MBS8262195.1 HlyC/CorC family transporter [Roseibium polysiphoniae]